MKLLSTKEWNRKYANGTKMAYSINNYEVEFYAIGWEDKPDPNVVRKHFDTATMSKSKHEPEKPLSEMDNNEFGQLFASLIKDTITRLKMIDLFRDYELNAKMSKEEFLKKKRIVRDWLNKLENTHENQFILSVMSYL